MMTKKKKNKNKKAPTSTSTFATSARAAAPEASATTATTATPTTPAPATTQAAPARPTAVAAPAARSAPSKTVEQRLADVANILAGHDSALESLIGTLGSLNQTQSEQLAMIDELNGRVGALERALYGNHTCGCGDPDSVPSGRTTIHPPVPASDPAPVSVGSGSAPAGCLPRKAYAPIGAPGIYGSVAAAIQASPVRDFRICWYWWNPNQGYIRPLSSEEIPLLQQYGI